MRTCDRSENSLRCSAPHRPRRVENPNSLRCRRTGKYCLRLVAATHYSRRKRQQGGAIGRRCLLATRRQSNLQLTMAGYIQSAALSENGISRVRRSPKSRRECGNLQSLAWAWRVQLSRATPLTKSNEVEIPRRFRQTDGKADHSLTVVSSLHFAALMPSVRP